jgi:hypothetical protein
MFVLSAAAFGSLLLPVWASSSSWHKTQDGSPFTADESSTKRGHAERKKREKREREERERERERERNFQ